MKKLFLKTCKKSQENTYEEAFFDKIAGSRLKKRLVGMFSINFAKRFRTAIYYDT